MKTENAPLIDKSGWGDGPWQTEPDRVEFRHAGLPCLMVRHPVLGHFCGYAAVPPGHPLHGKSSKEEDLACVDVHGGINYAAPCDGVICHVPEPGEPDNAWWFGFDCAHCFDITPGMFKTIGAERFAALFADSEYRDLAYVRRETKRLAEQLAERQER